MKYMNLSILFLFFSNVSYAFLDLDVGVNFDSLFKLEMNADMQKLYDSCQTIKSASDRLSEASERSSGNIRDGMKSLSSSLDNISQMPENINKLLEKRIPEIRQMAQSTIQEAQKGACSVIQQFQEGNKESIMLASRQFRNNVNFVLDKGIPDIEKRLRCVIAEFHAENRTSIQLVSQQFKELIEKAQGATKKTLLEINDMVSARLQDVNKIAEDINKNLIQFEQKVIHDLHDLSAKIDMQVQGWLNKIDKMSEKMIHQIADELTMLQMENQKLVKLVQEATYDSIHHLDETSKEKFLQAQILFERMRRGKWNLSWLGSSSGSPLVLGLFPGPVFQNAPSQICIYTLNFPVQGDWYAYFYPGSDKSKRIPIKIMGSNTGLEQIEVDGKFIEQLKIDETYYLQVEKRVTEQKEKVTIYTAQTMISRQEEVLELVLDLWIKDLRGNVLYPTFPLPEIQIKKYHKWSPIMMIDAPHLPNNTNDLVIRASLGSV